MKNIIIIIIVFSFVLPYDKYEYLVTEYWGSPNTQMGFLFKVPSDVDSKYNVEWTNKEESRGLILQKALNSLGEDGWDYLFKEKIAGEVTRYVFTRKLNDK